MRRRQIGAIIVGLAAVVASSEWHHVFGWDRAQPVILAAAVATVLSLGMSVRAETPRPLVATASTSLLVLVASLAALTGPSELIDSILNGWSRLLTTTVPSPADGDLLATPYGVSWVSAAVGTEVVLRVRRPLIALAAPVAAYIFALVYTAGLNGRQMGTAFTIAALGLLLAYALLPISQGTGNMARTRREGHRGTLHLRRMLGAVGIALATLAGSIVVGPNLPFASGREEFNPRADQEPPVEELSVIDPMSMLAGWALGSEDDDALFTVQAADAEDYQVWRLAVLDRYDPSLGWRVDTKLAPAGDLLPSGDSDAQDTVPLTHLVTIGDLQGPWLPAADRPTKVTGIDVFVDESSAVLATSDPFVPGLAFEVTSQVRTVAPDCTLAASSALTDADLLTPVDPGIADEAARLTEGIASPCARAQRIEEYLTSDDFEFERKAFSGSSMRSVRTLLDIVPEGSQPTDIARRGTSEQFATAFALLARASGLPTRVVVGFRSGTNVGDLRIVRPVDAFAWVEVRFEDLGWIAFVPTPTPGDQLPPPVLPDAAVEDDGTAADRGGSSAPPVEGDLPGTEPVSAGRSALESAALAFTGLILLIGGLLAIVAAVVSTTRRRRLRHRRDATEPSQRVVGAWRQCLDELRDSGVRPLRSASARDCVATSVSSLGDEPSAELEPVAYLVNAAFFSGEPITPDEADTAWVHADRLAALTAEGRSKAERVRRAVDVRVLSRS